MNLVKKLAEKISPFRCTSVEMTILVIQLTDLIN